MSRSDDPVQARLEQLLADYGTRLKGLLLSQGLQRHGIEPDDVEQDVRIRLWKALQRDPSGTFHASYIQRTVASAVIDALRRAKVRAADPLPDEEEEPGRMPEGGIDPEQSARESEQMSGVMRCLAEIPERRRLPIMLHLQGFALQEISDLVGTSVQSVRKLISRGMDDLRERLHEYGYGDLDE